MCILCQKYHGALSKGPIPKFSAANNMWLGDISVELQRLTIPEEKLISLHRHNNCIIELHSPTTALPFFKIYRILSTVYNLKLAICAIPSKSLSSVLVFPDRFYLRKILTVSKNEII